MKNRIARPASPVRSRREAAGLSQVVLAELAGVSPGSISLVERAPGLLRPTLAARLAGALGVDAKVLLVTRSVRGVRVIG